MISSDLVVWSSSMNARPWYLQGDIIGDTTVLCSVIDKIESMKIKPQCNIIVLKTGLVTYMMSSLYLTQPWLIVHHKENPVPWHCSLPDTDRSVHKQNCAFKQVVHDVRFIDVAKSSNVAKSNVSPDLTLQRKISAVESATTCWNSEQDPGSQGLLYSCSNWNFQILYIVLRINVMALLDSSSTTIHILFSIFSSHYLYNTFDNVSKTNSDDFVSSPNPPSLFVRTMV